MCTVLLPPGDNPIAVNKKSHPLSIIIIIYVLFTVCTGDLRDVIWRYHNGADGDISVIWRHVYWHRGTSLLTNLLPALFGHSNNTRNNEARSHTHCCRGKAINITYSECVSVALFTHHAERMRRSTLSSMACLTVLLFATLFHKRYDIEEKVIECKMRVLIFSTNFVWNISYFKKNWARYDHKYT
jgi:hypothetical protein